MPRTYRQLDLAERRTIFRLLNAKMPVAAIAQEVGRHRSTIHREIRRNHFHGPREYAGYYPLNAQDRASERRKRRCLGYRTPHEAFQDQLATLPRAA